MSRARLLCALAGLAFGFAFYFAYRSDSTLSNRLVRWLCTPADYAHAKQQVRAWLPVPVALRGCLPSALWCFIVATLLGEWRIPLWRVRTLPLAWIGVFFNAGWEAIQWAGWTDGRRDWRDVAAGLAGWAVANLIPFEHEHDTVVALRWSWRWGIVAFGFACMGLADVSK